MVEADKIALQPDLSPSKRMQAVQLRFVMEDEYTRSSVVELDHHKPMMLDSRDRGCIVLVVLVVVEEEEEPHWQAVVFD